jgi:RNA polymerase sigma-70 factor (ECF subfamily)
MQPFEMEDTVDDSTDDAALYDRYGQAIFAYIRLHTSSREDAEDLTLEVFTAALEHDNLAGSAPGEQLAWLRRVAHNRLIDGYRRRTRHPPVVLDTLADALLEDETGTRNRLRYNARHTDN